MLLKKFTPHVLAILLFAVITLIQFNPLFKGKVINQQDIIQHKGMSKEAVDYRNTYHEEPLWTNSMFGGMPAYQVSTVYSGNWLTHVDHLFHLFIPHPGGYIFMCFFGFFILLLCLEVNPWLALTGSLAYGFSSYFFIILEVGHNSKANAIGYLAPVLGGIILLMRNKFWLGFGITTLFMALEFNANHVQITYYGLMVYFLVFVAYFLLAVKEKKVKPFFIGVILFILSSLIALLPNAGNLLATYEYGKYTTRGKTELTIGADLKSNAGNVTSGLDKDYAVQYSHGIDETFTFLIPNFKGGSSGMPLAYADKDALRNVDPELREQVGNLSTYFGVQDSTAGPVYLGAIVMLLAFLGLFVVDHPLKWPLLIATILSMMLSWGKYFMGLSSFFMDYLPGYNKFRAVSMILVIAELTVPLLAVLALDKFIKSATTGQNFKIPFLGKAYPSKKILGISVVIVGGFCLLSYLVPNTVNSFTKPYEEAQLAEAYKESGASDQQVQQLLPDLLNNLEKARITVFKADALRSLLFILLSGLALYLYLLKKIKMGVVLLLLGIFITADMWPVATRFLNNRSFVSKIQFDAPPPKSAADEQILADPALDYRVLNLSVMPFQDATTSYYHKSIGGYHGAKLKKYDELIGFHLMKEVNFFSNGISTTGGSPQAIDSLTSKMQTLNMLNTKYFILPTRDNLVAVTNPNANGNAWFVKQLKTVASADSEIVALYNTDTKMVALVQKKNKPASVLNNFSAKGQINLESYQPNKLVYKTKSTENEFAVFSEIFYPKGWNSYLDGVLTPHYCVDYVLRGMEIPKGEHVVEFKFEPEIYKSGNTFSLIGSVVLLIVVFSSFYFQYRIGKPN